MKEKTKYIVFCLSNCIFSLLIGALIYVLVGGNTYINKIITIYPMLKNDTVFGELLRFYLADALWAYALTFSLSIFINNFCAGVTAFSFGLIWEISQKYSIISGTFDIIDIIMYLAASMLAVLIIQLNKRRNRL